MKNKYDKIMENIEVTPEVRDRILNNINKLDLEKTPNKVIPFHNYKKYLSIAACFVILLASSFLLHNLISSRNGAPPQQVVPDIVEYSSAKELSKAIGFTVKEIQNVPFTVETTKYTAYWKKLGQIQYTGQDNTAVLRMEASDEDISGDYTEYTSIKSIIINGASVTLKGNDGKYILAVWETVGYSYSIKFTNAISEKEMLTTVQSVK